MQRPKSLLFGHAMPNIAAAANDGSPPEVSISAIQRSPFGRDADFRCAKRKRLLNWIKQKYI